jgi:hypothetical protein
VITGALWFFLRRRKDSAFPELAVRGSMAEIDAVESSRHELPVKERSGELMDVAKTHELP